MSKQIKNAVAMTIALFFGLILYVLFRPQTYIAKIVAAGLSLKNLQIYFLDMDCRFLLYYFPDLLWSFAMSCGLLAIYDPGIKGKMWCCGVSVVCGAVWEMGQFLNVFTGTADMCDVLMYFFGACLCILLNMKEK